MLSQASVDVTDATEAPLQQACGLLDSFMVLFLLAPLLVPALWVAVTGAMKRSGKSSGYHLEDKTDLTLPDPHVQAATAVAMASALVHE